MTFVLHASPGEAIQDAAKRAIFEAQVLNQVVVLIHNDRRVGVEPSDTVDAVVHEWEILDPDGLYARGLGSTESRVTSDTGGEKGQKLAQLGAVDPLALLEVAKVAGFGGQKYARYNFMRGYDWSLSFDALQRHLLAFWASEDADPESGLPHLAHAAWHCLALMHFTRNHPQFDDRPKGATDDRLS